jgi:hypothetical protein
VQAAAQVQTVRSQKAFSMTKKIKHPEGSPCKPCWELKYCPYGPLVEHFPAIGQEINIEEIKASYDSAVQELTSGQIKDEESLWRAIDELMFLAPDNWEYISQFNIKELSCVVFGHICPVFLVAEGFSEIKEERKQGRYISRDVMLKVVRRDNHICQSCYQHVPDDKIEFDHIIPFSRGGPTNVENLRLLCRACNRKKSDALIDLQRKEGF